MVYRIGLCEDEEYYMKEMKDILKKYSLDNNKGLDIYTFKSGEELLKDYSTKFYNLLFLDVEMGELTGIETAKRIREFDKDVSIIFVTSYEDFALDAFRVSASQYIVKPANYDKLAPMLHKILNQIKTNAVHNDLTEQYIAVETVNGIVQVKCSDIKYIEKIKNRIDYYTTKGVFESYDTIKSLVQRLDPVIFVKINQGEIVNWNRVKEISGNTIIVDDMVFQISRNNKVELKERFEIDTMNMMTKKLLDGLN